MREYLRLPKVGDHGNYPNPRDGKALHQCTDLVQRHGFLRDGRELLWQLQQRRFQKRNVHVAHIKLGHIAFADDWLLGALRINQLLLEQDYHQSRSL
jgi:hypothetical protein